ncbi:AbrB/MazE/SpoVT family DNA-binding domain-containing protein [Nocardia ninae]|uniref:SpoVT-AbrB domain-containing protein n=1 Tax=Nocardia ninae NBRC 108245 TaxID=1210091 RepID=A0A511MDD1_9NOCA|nr:AbrB/MazE/SpoVT family DNA-binding domain-containing protein [Nocardia ninae]GEM38481.1 hypothetical protein NN4_30000 [Nocardia ninae NBRC 108245]
MSRFDRQQFHTLLNRYLDEAQSLLPPESPDPSDPLRLSEFAVSLINDRSRICGQRVFESMGWPPGTAIGFGVVDGVVTIGAVVRSRSVIDSRGHARLPAATRRAAGIEPGDPVLLVAMPEEGLVAVMGPRMLEQALASVLAPLRDPQSRFVIPILGPRER